MLKKLPSYREKQHILYIEHRSESNLIVYGDAFHNAGKISDAIDFYQKSNYNAGLEKIKEMAMQLGDVMLFQQVMKSLRQTASDEDWNTLGQRAFDLKKYSFALYAFEKGNNSTMIERTKGIIKSEENNKTT